MAPQAQEQWVAGVGNLKWTACTLPGWPTEPRARMPLALHSDFLLVPRKRDSQNNFLEGANYTTVYTTARTDVQVVWCTILDVAVGSVRGDTSEVAGLAVVDKVLSMPSVGTA